MERIITKPGFLFQKKETVSRTKSRKTENTASNILRVLHKIGLALTAISGAFLATPIQLPATVTSIAVYLGIAGTVVRAISKIGMGEEHFVQKKGA